MQKEEPVGQRLALVFSFSPPDQPGDFYSLGNPVTAEDVALGETGIISPGEVESIRAELPNPSSVRGMAPGAFARRLESWRDSVRSSVEDDLEARGVSADSMERALGWIATGDFGGSSGGGGSSGSW